MGKNKLGRRAKQEKLKHDLSVWYTVDLTATMIMLICSRVLIIGVSEEQELRDRNFISRTISDSDYDEEAVMDLQDAYSENINAVKCDKHGDPKKFAQKDLKAVDKNFFVGIDATCGVQTLKLKQRMLDWIKTVLTDGTYDWTGENAYLVESLIDVLDDAPEWEEEIDKNEEPDLQGMKE